MPTYDYRCSACGHEFEEFQSIKAAPLKKCPRCGKSKLIRLIGTGAGIIFKGSGFYETDYRSDSYKKGADAEKSAASGGKPDDKTETKTEPKPTETPAAASTPAKTASKPAKADAKPAKVPTQK